MSQKPITSDKRGETSPRFSFDLDRARHDLLTWFAKNPASHPWRLDFQRTGDPYVIWVSEIMLQQTVIKAVLPVYDRFLKRFPTLASLARASDDDVRTAVRGLGYYRRFGFLHKAAQQLAGSTGRKHVVWPVDVEGWKALPGVGDYTAAAVSSIAFNYPAAAVDGNVDRVIARLLGLKEPLVAGPVKKKIKHAAQALLDCHQPGRFNEAMMELGQTVCRPLNPKCDDCVFQTGCTANQKQWTHLIPAQKPAALFTDIKLNLYILRHGGRILICKRPAAAKFLKSTNGFATEIVGGKGRCLDGGTSALGLRRKEIQDLGEIKHGITSHRIRARVLLWDTKEAPIEGQWLAIHDVEPRLVSNLDRKAWRMAEQVLSKTGNGTSRSSRA